MKKTEKHTSVDYAIQGMLEKKGKQIVILDLRRISSAITDYFVICHGTSRPHIEAIAESVELYIKKKTGERPMNKEGFENAEWILIDYFDVVIHIFQETTRKFYKLEELWADAKIQNINNND